jgi:hypothetical protein
MPPRKPSRAGQARPERRRASRLQVVGDVHGDLVALEATIVVREMSAGGFSVQSDIAFPPGSEHQFRLTSDDGASVCILARAVHSLRLSVPGRLPAYVSGFEFLHEDQDSRRTVEQITERLAALVVHD